MNPTIGTKLVNLNGTTFVVTDYIFWVKGNLVKMRNVSTGAEHEKSVEEVVGAVREGKLKQGNDW